MFNMKKLLAGFSAVAVAASSMFANVAIGAGYSDDAEYVAAFNFFSSTGLTSTATPEAFMPGSNMLREHLARFVTYFALGNQCLEPDMTASCDFSDLSVADYTLQKYITTSCQLGVLKGSKGMFMPAKTVTKAELATALVRMLDGNKSENVEPRYANYFTAAKNLGLTKDTSYANWDRPVTRYEAALMMYRARDTQAQCEFDPTKIENDNDLWDWLEELFGDDTDTDDDDTTNDTIPTTSNGMVSIALSSTTPAGGRVAGLTSINVGSFNLMGKTDDTVLQSVTVERFGLNGNQAISKVELEVNGEVVGKSKSLNSDGKAVFSFSQPVVIKAGSSLTVDVVATIGDESVASNQDFMIGIADYETNGTDDKGNLPLKANEFVVAGVNGAEAVVSMDGTVSDKALGTKGAEVAKFKIKNDSSNETIFINQVSLKDDENNADENLKNFKLVKSDGTVVATTEMIAAGANNIVTFKLATPIEIKQGQTARFKMLADVVAGAGDNIEFKIDRASNIKGYSSKLGLGIAVDFSDYSGGGQSFSITAGEVTIVRNSLPKTKLLKNRDDFVIGSFTLKIASGAQLTLEDIAFVVATDTGSTATPIATLLENVQVRVNGSPNDLNASSTSSTTSVTYSDSDLGISLPAGGSVVLDLIADSANTFAMGDLGKSIKVTLNASNLSIVENDDDEEVTDIAPSVSTSEKVEFSDAAATVLALTLSTPFQAVVGAENVIAGEFQVRTTSAGAVSVQSLDIDGSTNFNSDYISAIKLWRQVGSSGSNRQEIDSEGGFDINGGTVTFDNFDEIVVPSSSTQTFRVTVDLVNSSANNGTIAALEVGAITLQDDDNNEITPTTSLPVGLVRAIQVTSAGSLTSTVDNTDSNTNQSKSVVAGNTSDFIASYEFVANNEDILLEDFVLVASGPNSSQFSKLVKSVDVYEMGTNGTTLLASEDVLDGQTQVQFNDFDRVISKGSKNLYFKVTTQKYGQNQPGIDFSNGISFALNVSTDGAEGVSSNQDITSPIATSYSLPFYVFPIRISNVAFVTSYAGSTVSTSTAPGSNVNLAIIKVTADNWMNTDTTDGSALNMLIDTIEVVNNSNYVSNLTLRRIDISNGTDVSGVGTTGDVSFDLTSASTVDREIGSSEIAYYLIQGDITGVPSGSNTVVRIDLENLDNGAFEFTHDGSGAGTYSALRLGFTRLDGTSITVNN